MPWDILDTCAVDWEAMIWNATGQIKIAGAWRPLRSLGEGLRLPDARLRRNFEEWRERPISR